MTVYIITLASVCLLCYIAEGTDWPEVDEYNPIRIYHSSDTRILYFVAACALIFVAGFRYKVGADYGAYYYGYQNYINSLPESIRSLDEPGYGLLAWVATHFFNDGAASIFLASLVTISLPLIVIYRYSDVLLLPTFLYVTMGGWDGSFNGVRQYLAAAVLFTGYKSLREKKIVNYCIIVFIAFLFHRSAIVFLLLYFVVNREINIQNIILLVVVSGLVLLSYDRVFSFANFVMDKEYSLDNVYTSTIVNRLRILAACIPSAVFLYAYYGEEKKETTIFALNIVMLRTALSVLTMNSALLYRINIYTSFFAPLAITELIKGISEKNRKWIIVGFVSMYLVMWWYEIYKAGSMNHFRWIWDRPTM